MPREYKSVFLQRICSRSLNCQSDSFHTSHSFDILRVGLNITEYRDFHVCLLHLVKKMITNHRKHLQFPFSLRILTPVADTHKGPFGQAIGRIVVFPWMQELNCGSWKDKGAMTLAEEGKAVRTRRTSEEQRNLSASRMLDGDGYLHTLQPVHFAWRPLAAFKGQVHTKWRARVESTENLRELVLVWALCSSKKMPSVGECRAWKRHYC